MAAGKLLLIHVLNSLYSLVISLSYLCNSTFIHSLLQFLSSQRLGGNAIFSCISQTFPNARANTKQSINICWINIFSFLSLLLL